MKHLVSLLPALLASCLLGLGCRQESQSLPEAEPHKGPNVVLIIADDQGWGDLGLSGNRNIKTPHINGLARYGARFTNFYVQPVCSPTRAEVLTGSYFPRMGVYDTSAGGERMDTTVRTMADVFKRAGYATAAYGKWHSGTQPPYHPNSRGFEDFYGFASGHWGHYFGPMLEHNGEVVQGEGFLPDDLTNKALNFIENHAERPFFLYLPYNTPHSPMQVPDAYWEVFQGIDLPMLQDREEEDPAFTKAALAMVENIDENVGRILAKLRKLYLDDDTIVIYLSDNGPNSYRWNGGMRGRKGSVDEGGVRSPCFIQWEDSIPPGREVDPIAGAIDLLPTLLNLSGLGTYLDSLPPTQSVDGRDLSPLLFDENADWTERLLYNHWNGRTSVRSQQFRLDDQNRLYDIRNDRGQYRDVSDAYPEIHDSLVTAKKNWLGAVAPVQPDSAEVRPFTLGHPDAEITWLPARDGIGHGGIERSNRFPNDSYFTDWKSLNDSITWNVSVIADGHFEVMLYHTASPGAVGSIMELGLGSSKIAAKINEVHNPQPIGMNEDRVPRQESYVKDFKPIRLGELILKKGQGVMTLKALAMPNGEAVDMRLLTFRRLGE